MPDGRRHLVVFYDGHLLGLDFAEPSWSVDVVDQTADSFTVDYALFAAGQRPPAPPTGAKRIAFAWDAETGPVSSRRTAPCPRPTGGRRPPLSCPGPRRGPAGRFDQVPEAPRRKPPASPDRRKLLVAGAYAAVNAAVIGGLGRGGGGSRRPASDGCGPGLARHRRRRARPCRPTTTSTTS